MIRPYSVRSVMILSRLPTYQDNATIICENNNKEAPPIHHVWGGHSVGGICVEISICHHVCQGL